MLMKPPMRTETRTDYKQRLLCVLIHIQKHLGEALSLDDLAAVAHFSPYHFHRVFRGMIGESVQSHIRRLRLERAAHRLKFTDQAVTRIAFDAGYEAHEAFTRAFRSMFSQPPSEFRKHHQSVPVGQTPSGVHFSPDGTVSDFSPVTPNPPVDVEVKTVDPMHVVFARHTGAYDQVGATWSKLFAWAGPRGLVGPNVITFAVVHDDPAVTPPGRLRYDACLVVGAQAQPDGDIGVQTVSGGTYAVTRHLGPYANLGDTYAKLCGAWLPTSKHELRSAPALEFYRNAPMNTPPEQLITDIYMPLEN